MGNGCVVTIATQIEVTTHKIVGMGEPP